MIVDRLKIIVAEDSELQRLVLCSLINGLGFEAVEAEDGVEALNLVMETGAQIVISDIEMPNLDGINLTRKIRELELDHYIHVVLVTGADENEIRDEALEAGADDFITKGSSTAMLKARIRTATRLISHAAELAERSRILKEINEHIQEDLRAAATAQRQLLPDLQEDIMGFRIASAFVPSAIVSGDMFGCFPISDTKLGFYAVDVSGHGVHASLLSVAIGHLITPAYFRTQTMLNDLAPDPAALVTSLNDRFSPSDNDDYFTMFCGIVDTATGRLDYCQAGYPSPYYVDLTGATEPVGDGGFPVGMIPSATYENKIHHLDAGGALIICSDAACEAENPSHELFGNDRVRMVAATTPFAGVQDIPTHIVDALNMWRDGKPLEDDLTVVAIERKNSHDTHSQA
ncbi:Serine phosphatase RsbU, regulator of sigma subunit [Yoonia tamlensis]|uniref:Serine phosphatase RsbU, regulator of sigma subunit n=1 Tax=Yoonia tamlensis TaxID=390270 RepID=A0A1I6G9D7_9RHOB|nr:SpoIIE family protein phosphatase [Yoonia tamlensis]SFR38770.1 Serine phosphatase RsbU, regulator of sigma subunit [Yoonia tamlensis]